MPSETKMEDQVAYSFNSSPFPSMLSPEPGNPDHCNPYGSIGPKICQGSFNENLPFHSLPHGYSISQAAESVDTMYEPWVVDASSCDSPLSTSSSTNPSESELTQPYSNQPGIPLPYMQQARITHTSDAHISQFNWMDDIGKMDDIGTAWHQNGSGVSIWAEQLYLSSWGSNNYTNPSISALQPSFPPLSNRLTTLLAHPVPLHYSSDTNIKSASFTSSPNTIVDTIVNGGDSDSDSDSSNSEDESDCGQNKRSHCSTNTRHQGRQNTSPVLKLGKWTAPVDPYDQTDQRHYLCPFSSKADPNGGICRQRFVRPEHLRRHVKTVHGTAREYTCKVPKCRRAFSRGDNLRDHYWTHLSRGGRAGRNDKMSLEELKVILGPKERKLLRRLKAKLNKHKNRGMLRSKL